MDRIRTKWRLWFYNAIRAVLRGKEIYQDTISGIPKEDIYELVEEMKTLNSVFYSSV